MSNAGDSNQAKESELSPGPWRYSGLTVANRDSTTERIHPLELIEDDSHGNHWAHCRIERARQADQQATIQAHFSCNDASYLRVRVDTGEPRVLNAIIDLQGHKILSSEFPKTAIEHIGGGLIKLTLAFDLPENSEHSDLGLMLMNDAQTHLYAGNGKRLTIYGVTAWSIPSERTSSNARHTRYSEFGRTAFALCKGKGLEIGALHRPFDLDAQVTYLDYEPTKKLREDYRNDTRVGHIQQVQLVCKSSFYPFIDSEAFDFVINSHVLEHVCNPGRTIQEWLRIIRPGGMLYMVVPDKHHTFDKPRAVTTVAHLMEDFHTKLDEIPRYHYEDYVRNREGGRTGQDAERVITQSFNAQSSIHVHVFEPSSIQQFLKELKPLLGFELEHFESQGMHMHMALRKR